MNTNRLNNSFQNMLSSAFSSILIVLFIALISLNCSNTLSKVTEYDASAESTSGGSGSGVESTSGGSGPAAPAAAEWQYISANIGTPVDTAADGYDGISIDATPTTLDAGDFLFTTDLISVPQVPDVLGPSLYAIDISGTAATPEFYMFVDSNNVVTFNDQSDGAGNTVTIVKNNASTVIGYDTDADGFADMDTSFVAVGAGPFTAGITINNTNAPVENIVFSILTDSQIYYLSTDTTDGAGVQNFSQKLNNNDAYTISIAIHPPNVTCEIGGTGTGVTTSSNLAVALVNIVYGCTSNDATLSGLTLSSGAFTPTFTSAQSSYTSTVPNGTATVTVTGTTNDANSTMYYNGVLTASGVASANINLDVGWNSIAIYVLAENQVVNRSYTLNVYRSP